jgi:hypothetical protein
MQALAFMMKINDVKGAHRALQRAYDLDCLKELEVEDQDGD